MKVSVYITSYNQKNYLVEAIESVLSQTIHPYQVIIVDDASDDNSQELILGYANQYPELITPIFHENNYGVAVSRNDALKVVTGDWVVYVDGDDRLLPTKLETEIRLLGENHKAKIAYSNYFVIDSQGRRIDIWSRKPTPEGDIFVQTFGLEFPKMRPFRDEMVHYQSWKEIGFYDTNLRVYEDWEMRIRLTKKLGVLYTGEVLSEHRRLGTGLSKLDGNVYLHAYKYVRQKNYHLLDDLKREEQERITRRLDHFQAYLLRRIGRQALTSKQGYITQRVIAWSYYLESQKYHKQIDFPFWSEFLLSPMGYQAVKSIYSIWNNNVLRRR